MLVIYYSLLLVCIDIYVVIFEIWICSCLSNDWKCCVMRFDDPLYGTEDAWCIIVTVLRL
jgi:hypothetical protein